MKKVLLTLLFILIVFMVLLYWSLSSTDKEFEKSVMVNYENVDTIDFRKLDSIVVRASDLYKADEIKKFMQGRQYRDAWEAEIKVPVVYLDSLLGGVTIDDEGGGKQTHSLKLLTKNGTLYTMRSINKDPQALIPEFARTLNLQNIVVDGISAQHPYGALLAARLAEAVSVIHTHPKVIFVPEQKELGEFNEKYGNRLYLLEYETEGDVNWTHLDNVIELMDTKDIQELKQEGKPISIDKRALIRSRLFDLIIGDWDRHAKQWGWAVQELNDSLVAVPIGGDRDNAFFDTDGLIPSIMTNKHVVPDLRPFEDDIDFMEGLVYPFDRYFLLNTPLSLFQEEAEYIKTHLTDSKIKAALEVWPENITSLDGEAIVEKIMSRRNKISEYASEFKRIIDTKGKLTEPLKGSEDEDLSPYLQACFDCREQ